MSASGASARVARIGACRLLQQRAGLHRVATADRLCQIGRGVATAGGGELPHKRDAAGLLGWVGGLHKQPAEQNLHVDGAQILDRVGVARRIGGGALRQAARRGRTLPGAGPRRLTPRGAAAPQAPAAVLKTTLAVVTSQRNPARLISKTQAVRSGATSSRVFPSDFGCGHGRDAE